MKHTPGPWFLATSMSGKKAIAQEADMYSIALIETWRAEHEANAKLIAAAPELLSVANDILTSFNADTMKLSDGNFVIAKHEIFRLCASLEAAIKKATK